MSYNLRTIEPRADGQIWPKRDRVIDAVNKRHSEKCQNRRKYRLTKAQVVVLFVLSSWALAVGFYFGGRILGSLSESIQSQQIEHSAISMDDAGLIPVEGRSR